MEWNPGFPGDKKATAKKYEKFWLEIINIFTLNENLVLMYYGIC